MPAVIEPEILAVVPGDQQVRVALKVPPDLSWFEGHFPGCPLLPGVIQLTWAIRFGRRYLGIAGDTEEIGESLLSFQRLSNLKFMRFILPGSEVALLLEYDAKRRELSFEYRQSDAVCAAGTIGFESAS